MNFHSHRSQQKGFTLIEVMITSFILALISIGIYQATNSTFRLREQLKGDGDFYNGTRLAMGIVERDIMTLYSPTVMLPEPSPSVTPTSQGNAGETPREIPDSDFWEKEANPQGIRKSRFYGKESSMLMVTTSHIRIYNESLESDFAKITYGVATDPRKEESLEGVPAGLKQLTRSESTRVFESESLKDPSLKEYILLRGLKKITFTYFDKPKDRWETTWDSADEFKRGRFPSMVKIELEVAGPNRLNFVGSYIFRPELPFNGVPSTF